MRRRRLPRTLFRGRMRTSTFLLMLAFFGVLTLWVSVRPTTLETTDEVLVRHTNRTTTDTQDEPDQRRREPTPTPTPKVTPTATPPVRAPVAPAVPTGKKVAPAPVAPPPSAGPAAPLAPPPTGATPGQPTPTSRSFGILPHHGGSTPQPDAGAATPSDPNAPPG